MTSRFADADPNYLKRDQYRDARNVNARIALHDRFSVNPTPWFEWLAHRIPLSRGQHLLDIGCGPAALWRTVGATLPQASLTLADFSPGMLEAARAAVSDVPHEFRFEVANAQELPFDDASFDIVMANHMLYHVPDRTRALAEFARVLRPNGRFLASTNGIKHLRELSDLVERFAPGQPRHDNAFAEAFGFATGVEQVRAHFTEVSLERYPDELRVTEVEPLIAFILSSWSAESFGDRLDELRAHIAERIAKDGAFVVSKQGGLITATGPHRR